MNKNLLLKVLRSLWRISVKLLLLSLTMVVWVLSNDKLHKKIKDQEKWESDYDQHTANVTKRNFLY